MPSYAPSAVVCGRMVVLLLVALGQSGFASDASAQAKSNGSAASGALGASGAANAPSPPGYDRAIDLAIREFDLGNYAEARSRFLEAHRLFPSARTFRALGMVEYELKNYGDAIEALKKGLASNVRPLEGSARLATQELLDRAEGYVARIHLDVTPESATVMVDGVLTELGLGGVLVLQVGDHSLELRAPGRLVERRHLKINGGEEMTIQVVLPPAVDLSGQPGREARPLYKNPWLWTAVGVVAVGAGIGLGIGLSGTETKTSTPLGGTTGVALAGPK